jgi:hypothetical protein
MLFFDCFENIYVSDAYSTHTDFRRQYHPSYFCIPPSYFTYPPLKPCYTIQ